MQWVILKLEAGSVAMHKFVQPWLAIGNYPWFSSGWTAKLVIVSNLKLAFIPIFSIFFPKLAMHQLNFL